MITTALLMASCARENSVESTIKALETPIELNRFEAVFGGSGPSDLEALKLEYPFFFPSQTPDSIWRLKLQDSLEKDIVNEISTRFATQKDLKKDLTHLFAHYRHLLGQRSDLEIQPPEVYTLSMLSSGLDVQNRVVTTDSLWLIALDHYLGPDHEYYRSFPRYIRQELNPDYIVSDVAAALVGQLLPSSANGYFLNKMVLAGKKIFLQSFLWPHKPLAHHLKYTEDQYRWALDNEAEVWRYFMEREYLYSTETDLEYRFLYPAPFSKFQLALDSESPPRIAQFIGFQMAKAYFESHDKNIQQLIAVPPLELLKEATYKPKK